MKKLVLLLPSSLLVRKFVPFLLMILAYLGFYRITVTEYKKLCNTVNVIIV